MSAPARIGPYRVERLLGVGSFATVWLAHDPALDTRVAVKVLAENWSHDLRVRERFRDEARLLWRLDSERVVRVHALGELPDGRPYTVMEWADGGSLRERLGGRPVPVGAGVGLLREIAAGVAVLHDAGIVHRDLSPGNVLFRAGRVVIADLGLAKALAAASGLTARAGTPGYMAPEQDSPLAIVDTRADVYGLGRLGVRLLASEAGSGRVRLRTGVPPRVGEVLRVATARRPDDRFADASAFGAALDRAAGSVAAAAGRRRVAAAAGLALALAASGAALAGDAADLDRTPRPPATASDPTGRLTVTLPAGWRATGSGWEGRRGPDGRREPALVISPDPARWPTDPTVPGAFVGLSATIDASPADFLAGRTHAGCHAEAVRASRQAGIDWVVAAYTGCAAGKPVLVESAGVATGAAAGGLVYVQVAPPAGKGAAFVDALLAGVRVG
jgi:serine/threonine protein kinase